MNPSNHLLIRTIAFLIFIPGTVVGVLPGIILWLLRGRVSLDWARYFGIFPILTGTSLLFIAVAQFYRQGKGTPMIYFASKTKWALGEEPQILVVSKLYRISRNPMYLGVFLLVMGEALLWESISLMLYGIMVFVGFHCVVVFGEEPHLAKKHGASYVAYLNSVPRWINLSKYSRKGRRN